MSGRCIICGCSDHAACHDPGTGETCSWLLPPDEDGNGVCSFCLDPDEVGIVALGILPPRMEFAPPRVVPPFAMVRL